MSALLWLMKLMLVVTGRALARRDGPLRPYLLFRALFASLAAEARDSDDIELLNAMTDQAAVAVENALLYARQVEQEHVNRALQR